MNTITKTENRPQAKEETITYLTPGVDIVETKDGYILEAEMPGVNKDGLEVLLEGNELTIIGHRNAIMPNAEVVYRECKPSDFRRVFELDPAIDTAKIDAKVEQGVLIMNLPKSERVRPRRIAIAD